MSILFQAPGVKGTLTKTSATPVPPVALLIGDTSNNLSVPAATHTSICKKSIEEASVAVNSVP